MYGLMDGWMDGLSMFRACTSAAPLGGEGGPGGRGAASSPIRGRKFTPTAICNLAAKQVVPRGLSKRWAIPTPLASHCQLQPCCQAGGAERSLKEMGYSNPSTSRAEVVLVAACPRQWLSLILLFLYCYYYYYYYYYY